MEFNSNRKNRDRTEIQSTLDNERNLHSVERFFSEDQTARLETMIPAKIKRDLTELTGCIDTKGTGATRAANRLITEALADLFNKYQKGEGSFKLIDEPTLKGSYK